MFAPAPSAASASAPLRSMSTSTSSSLASSSAAHLPTLIREMEQALRGQQLSDDGAAGATAAAAAASTTTIFDDMQSVPSHDGSPMSSMPSRSRNLSDVVSPTNLAARSPYSSVPNSPPAPHSSIHARHTAAAGAKMLLHPPPSTTASAAAAPLADDNDTDAADIALAAAHPLFILRVSISPTQAVDLAIPHPPIPAPLDLAHAFCLQNGIHDDKKVTQLASYIDQHVRAFLAQSDGDAAAAAGAAAAAATSAPAHAPHAPHGAGSYGYEYDATDDTHSVHHDDDTNNDINHHHRMQYAPHVPYAAYPEHDHELHPHPHQQHPGLASSVNDFHAFNAYAASSSGGGGGGGGLMLSPSSASFTPSSLAGTLNSTLTSQRASDRVGDRLYHTALQRLQRRQMLHERAIESKRQEEEQQLQQLTFTPTISEFARSMPRRGHEMWQRIKDSDGAELKQRREQLRQRFEREQSEEMPFAPRIDPVSSLLAQSRRSESAELDPSTHCGNRLYMQEQERVRERAAREREEHRRKQQEKERMQRELAERQELFVKRTQQWQERKREKEAAWMNDTSNAGRWIEDKKTKRQVFVPYFQPHREARDIQLNREPMPVYLALSQHQQQRQSMLEAQQAAALEAARAAAAPSISQSSASILVQKKRARCRRLFDLATAAGVSGGDGNGGGVADMFLDAASLERNARALSELDELDRRILDMIVQGCEEQCITAQQQFQEQEQQQQEQSRGGGEEDEVFTWRLSCKEFEEWYDAMLARFSVSGPPVHSLLVRAPSSTQAAAASASSGRPSSSSGRPSSSSSGRPSSSSGRPSSLSGRPSSSSGRPSSSSGRPSSSSTRQGSAASRQASISNTGPYSASSPARDRQPSSSTHASTRFSIAVTPSQQSASEDGIAAELSTEPDEEFF